MNSNEIKRLPIEGNFFVKGFYGESCFYGLLLEWSAIPKNAVFDGYYYMEEVINIKESTPNWEQRKVNGVDVEAPLLIVAIVIAMGMGIVGIMSVSTSLIMVGVCTIMAIIMCKRRTQEIEREAAQWHAAEHKVVFLLEENLPLVLEEAKRAPMVHEHCRQNNKTLMEPKEEQLRAALKVAKKMKRRVEKIITN